MTEERQLISRAQNGDMTAFRPLVEQHQRNVYFLALDLSGHPQDAEDLAQEVFIRAFRFLGNFRGEAKFSSWLYRITVNRYIGNRRKKQVHSVPLQNSNTETGTSPEMFLTDRGAPDPEETAAAGDIQQHIRQALAKLSPRERAVFVLRWELEHSQIPLPRLDMGELHEQLEKLGDLPGLQFHLPEIDIDLPKLPSRPFRPFTWKSRKSTGKASRFITIFPGPPLAS